MLSLGTFGMHWVLILGSSLVGMLNSLTLGGSILRYGLVAAIGVIFTFGVIVRYEYDWEV